MTPAGAAWLASASRFPRSVQALWSARPWAPSVLPCGANFDVVNMPVLFGRSVLEQLWAAGPGCGPVARHRSRLLVFTAPGTAARLPTLLSWEEWSGRTSCREGRPDGAGTTAERRGGYAGRVPPLLCHGTGDAVTVPPLHRMTDTPCRWVVAPDTRHPWLPAADVLLWACVRAARGEAARR